MEAVKTIGLDIAKSVFQVHGVDANGQAVVRRKLKRRYVLAFFQKVRPCLVGMEACAKSHYRVQYIVIVFGRDNGQHEAQQRDHGALTLGDSLPYSMRMKFSLHTGGGRRQSHPN